MLRAILAVMVGLIAGMIFNMAMVVLNTTLHPMPEGVDFNDAEGMKAYFATLPVIAFVLILVAHVGQAFVGGLVAAVIGRNATIAVAMTVGLLSMVGGILNMMSMPLPGWMWIEMPLYPVAAWFAARLVLARRAAGAVASAKNRTS